MNTASFIDRIIAFILLSWTSIEDLKTYTMSLFPMLFSIIGGLVVSFMYHGWHGLIESVIGAVVGGGIGWLLMWGAKLGEGDVLLYIALGVLFGAPTVMTIIGLSSVLVALRLITPMLQHQKIRVAVAPYIALGTVISLFVNHLA